MLPEFAAECPTGKRHRSIAVDTVYKLQVHSAANPLVTTATVDQRERQVDERRDGQTPDCYIDPAPHIMRAGSFNFNNAVYSETHMLI